jgi:hypothetical protein
VPDAGVVTRSLLALAGDGTDNKTLAAGICHACTEGLDVDGAAISMLTTTDARGTLFATDATAEMLEELQFTLNEGACMEAGTDGNPVLVPDICGYTEQARWPVFIAAVLEQTDARALFALPLQWGAVNLGVLDLYRRAPGVLTEDQQRDAISAAEIAALMLLDQVPDPVGGRGTWFDTTVLSRAEVHQATGMVLVQLDVSAAEALARMRGHAFAEGRLLIDVARDVVGRRLAFARDPE